jgi:RNA 3'-terminal phosphate cyclase (ATP)
MFFHQVMTSPLSIDGSYGEGGGQILRTALALSVLQRRPIIIDHIRANRSRPGLRPQHLQAVQALAAIGAAELEGAEVNSTRLSFRPSQLKAGSYRFEIGTAGACTLLLAAILPPLLFASASSEVVVTGGTHVPFSPPYHYFAEVFLPALAVMGGRVVSELGRWGWYPEGGGEIRIRITPCRQLKAVRLEKRGQLLSLDLLVGLSHLPGHIGRRELETVERCLLEKGYRPTSRMVEAQAQGRGNAVVLKAIFEHSAVGFTALGRRGKPAEQVAEEVCREWFSFMVGRAGVDRHLADQLIPYLALASGFSSLVTEELTAHLRTNIWVTEQFLPVCFKTDSRNLGVGITGSGYQAIA